MPLTADSFKADPTASRLCLQIGAKALSALIVGPDGEVVYQQMELQPELEPERALEEAIYDNPLLLTDFANVTVLFDTERFVVLPPSKADDGELIAEIFESLYPDLEADAVVTPVTETGPEIVAAVPSALLAFVRRTFNNPDLTHPLGILATYMSNIALPGTSGKMCVNLRDGHTDVLAFADGNLLMANTFHTPSAADATYYTLACARQLNFDPEADQMLVAGQPHRQQLLDALRPEVKNVMPMPIPGSLARLGREAMRAPLAMALFVDF